MRSAIALLLSILPAASAHAFKSTADAEVKQIVTQEVGRLVGGAGAAVVARIDGRNLFFSFGYADRSARRPVTSDSLFNLASVSKVLDATLLALAVRQGEISFDDPVGKYIAELRHGCDIGAATLGQLITFTSGFRLPQDHPPYPAAHFTLERFLAALEAWRRDPEHRPGRDYVYSHAGIMLLHVALERRFGVPYAQLLNQKLLRRLGLAATTLPVRGTHSAGVFAPSLRSRLVQGYSQAAEPIGRPGDIQGHYYWPGSGQMFSSARDMAVVLAAHLGEAGDAVLREATALTLRQVAPVRQHVMQAQAWGVHQGAVTIIDKNGGLSNSTTYIGMVRDKRIGIVILINRGWLDGREIGHPILSRLALPPSTKM